MRVSRGERVCVVATIASIIIVRAAGAVAVVAQPPTLRPQHHGEGPIGESAADTFPPHLHLSTCPEDTALLHLTSIQEGNSFLRQCCSLCMTSHLLAQSQAECGVCEQARGKTRQAGRHEERQRGHPPLPARWSACMYVCVCVCVSLLLASVHMTDRGCRRHAYMPCMQAAQVPMRASYSSSHICTHVCMHTRPGPARARGDPCCSRCIMHARMRAAGCHWRPRHMHTHAYACTSNTC